MSTKIVLIKKKQDGRKTAKPIVFKSFGVNVKAIPNHLSKSLTTPCRSFIGSSENCLNFPANVQMLQKLYGKQQKKA